MILLSFDIEEFDMPLEYKGKISFKEQIEISRKGTQEILRLLKKYDAKATFFSTVVFAENNKDLIKEIVNNGHEIASHTWFHSDFQTEHLATSKQRLEEISASTIRGLRMPRMSPVGEEDVAKAGYSYNSSINPTFLPGRYNNLHISRNSFYQGSVLQLPASVSPRFRIPLFWLSFHNFPLWLYKLIMNKTYKKDNYINIYFHPWEFENIKNSNYKLPFYTTKNTGKIMSKRFETLLNWIKKKNYPFGTISEYITQIENRGLTNLK